MRETNDNSLKHESVDRGPRLDDEGGLHVPSRLHGGQKVWWWFHFLILVNLARLRFIGILVVIGLIIMKWDWLVANYDKLTRPVNPAMARVDRRVFLPHASDRDSGQSQG